MHRIAKKLAAAQTLQGDVRQGLAALLREENFASPLQEATISVEHFESDLAPDDLPALVTFEVSAAHESLPRACRGMDVQVKVKADRPAQVHVVVAFEDFRSFQQLSPGEG